MSRYRIVDVARKLVGVGSLGTECLIVLLMGLEKEELFGATLTPSSWRPRSVADAHMLGRKHRNGYALPLASFTA